MRNGEVRLWCSSGEWNLVKAGGKVTFTYHSGLRGKLGLTRTFLTFRESLQFEAGAAARAPRS